MASQKTKIDLIRRITGLIGKQRARPDIDEINDLLNEAIGIISDTIEPFETSWNNDTGGALTLSGYTFTLPRDCVEPISVEWDGVPLTKADRSRFDEMDDQWRDTDNTGTPTYWFSDGVYGYLDTRASGTVVGMLVLRGMGNIPEFPANDATSPNPLTYFPAGFQHQFLPCSYVIAQLPVELEMPVSDKPEALRHADLVSRMRMELRDRHEKMWEQGLLKLADAYARRGEDVFRF